MASNPVLHEATQNNIRWCVTRRLDLHEPGCVTFQKRGKHGRQLFSQLYRWDAEQGDWARVYGRPTSPRVPNYLTAKIEAALKEEFAAKPEPVPAPRPVPGGPPVRVPIPVNRSIAKAPTEQASSGQGLRRSFPGAKEAIGNGRMIFPAFLARELVRAHHPELYRRELGNQA